MTPRGAKGTDPTSGDARRGTTRSVKGLRMVDGRGLAKLLRSGEPRLSDAQIEGLASGLDKLFRPNVRSN